jgi:hypothetical protein
VLKALSLMQEQELLLEYVQDELWRADYVRASLVDHGDSLSDII